MNSKNTTYFLMASLFFIWGYVSFLVFKNFNKKPDFTEQLPQKNHAEQLKVNNFEYTLLLNYPNPFKLLGNMNTPLNTSTNNLPQISTTTKPKSKNVFTSKPIENKPLANQSNSADIIKKIQYYGLIQNNSNQDKVAVLIYNKEEYLVEKGTKITDFIIENIHETHMEILINETTHSINITEQ